jgi:hypothetical protein
MRSHARLLSHIVAPLLAVILLVACGSSGGGASTGGLSTVPGSVVKPCPGGASGVTDAGQPDLILTETATSGEAHVGQVVQARLAAKYRWSLAGPVASLATQVNGDYDERAGVCFWTFKAVSSGGATLTFNGALLCDPQQACAAIVKAETFTVSIT